MSTRKSVSLIAAACRNNGIGVNGRLPWRLKNEMAFFTRTTETTDLPDKKNAVIMGRRTWECIPAKYRPLSGRINVVLSQTLTEVPSGADFLFQSLPEAVEALSAHETIDKLFVIGGGRVYAEALSLPSCSKVYLTRVDAEFVCDAFFPEVDMTQFSEINEENIPTEVQEEDGLQYKYHVYEKVIISQ
ncbi:Dihydrofolate reductase [Halotydeus destructor]|nr:Dihydrofolate reductase [Halotydeus destructor]